jgi:hypothetical protein
LYINIWGPLCDREVSESCCTGSDLVGAASAIATTSKIVILRQCLGARKKWIADKVSYGDLNGISAYLCLLLSRRLSR